MHFDDTIAAISTPHGAGGIAVIRISGADAVSIADSVFSDSLENVGSHTVTYGYITDGVEKIDEVLVTVMRAPKTFTREDVVEISTHGGIFVTNRVLSAVLAKGARAAQPGEFTKRAFLNGRIDLSRAEAVIDIINSENALSEKNAIEQLGGRLSKKIEDMRSRLVNLSAHMQVAIDYPDEDLEDITVEDIIDTLGGVLNDAQKLVLSADDGRIIKGGIKTVIAGKPNVGKSTILNMLSGFDRAIVTDIAGTTRDIIEENISLSGIPIKLVDTAGVHDTDDFIEKIGVEKSEKSIDGADLVLLVTDASSPMDDDDRDILKKCENKKKIIIANKTDKGICEEAANTADIFICAKDGEGKERIAEKISELYAIGDISQRSGEIITNERQKAALVKCVSAVSNAIETLKTGLPQDMASIDIADATDALGEITGASVSEDIVSAVFKNFCVGK